MATITPMGHILDAVPSTPDPNDYTYQFSLVEPPPHARLPGIDRVPVLDQYPLGACTANAAVAARAALLSAYVALSRLFVYWNERAMEGTVNDDVGASVRDAGGTLLHYGAPPEAEEPYDITRFREQPTQQQYADALAYRIRAYYRQRTTRDIRRALAYGHPVLLGHAVHQSYENVGADGMIPMPGGADDPLLGFHCTWLYGYDRQPDGTYLYHDRGSWSAAWGDHGDCHVTDAWLGNTAIVVDAFSLSA